MKKGRSLWLALFLVAVASAEECQEGQKVALPGSCMFYEECLPRTKPCADPLKCPRLELQLRRCPGTMKFEASSLSCKPLPDSVCPKAFATAADICKTGEKKPDTLDSSKYYQCNRGLWTLKSCWWPFKVFENGSCRLKASGDGPQESCKGQWTRPDLEDCSKYYQCDGSYLQHKTCTVMSRFDSVELKCKIGWFAKCAKPDYCYGIERKPVPGNCREYYECSEGKLEVQTCLLGYYFDPRTTVCKQPSEVDCKDTVEHLKEVKDTTLAPTTITTTPATTQFPTTTQDPNKCVNGEIRSVEKSCKKYQVCDGNAWTLKTCKWCKNFDPEALKCVWAWKHRCVEPTEAPMTSSGTSGAPMTSRGTSAAPMTSRGTSAAPMTSRGTSDAPATSRGTSAAPMTSRGTSDAPATSRGTSAAPMTSRNTSAAPMTSRNTSEAPMTTPAPYPAEPCQNGATHITDCHGYFSCEKNKWVYTKCGWRKFVYDNKPTCTFGWRAPC